MNPLLERVTGPDGAPRGWSFWCPGCERDHVVPVEAPNGWAFNGDEDAPTFSPSILCRTPSPVGLRVCHLFVQSGQLVYLGDCTHKLAGQMVPMVPRPDDKEFTP